MMYKETARLPFGYAVEPRTKEEGGGWLLWGGVLRKPNPNHTEKQREANRYSVMSGKRKVASWVGPLQVEEVERLAALDYHSRSALTDEERRINARAFVKATGGDVARIGMPEAKGRNDEEKSSGRRVRLERGRYKRTWGEA